MGVVQALLMVLLITSSLGQITFKILDMPYKNGGTKEILQINNVVLYELNAKNQPIQLIVNQANTAYVDGIIHTEKGVSKSRTSKLRIMKLDGRQEFYYMFARNKVKGGPKKIFIKCIDKDPQKPRPCGMDTEQEWINAITGLRLDIQISDGKNKKWYRIEPAWTAKRWKGKKKEGIYNLSLNVSLPDMFIISEERIFMGIIGSIFGCLWLAIGGFIGYYIRIDREKKEDKVYVTDTV